MAGGYEVCHNPEEVIAAIGYSPDADTDNPCGSVFCSHGAGMVVPWDQVEDYMHLEATLPAWTGQKVPAQIEPAQEIRVTTKAGTDLLFFLMPGYLGELPQTLCEVHPSVSRVPLYRFYILDENGDRPSNLPDTGDDLAEINRIWRQAGMELISSLLMFGVHESDQSVDLPRSSVRAADYEGNVAFPKNGLSNLHRTPSSIVEP